MKTVFFIRTAPYEYLIEGLNLYKSFNAVANLSIEVPLRPDARSFFMRQTPKEIYESISVYCSPRKRSIATAKYVSAEPHVFPFLAEVNYCMENFITKADFFSSSGSPNVNKARKNFVNALINNKLNESYEEVMLRIDRVLRLITKEENDNVIIISHGFFLKIIEACIRDPRVRKNSKQLLRYFNGEAETFHFCEGFTVEYKDKKIAFGKYIRNLEII